MEWTVSSLECPGVDTRESLLQWVDTNHPVDVPAGTDHVHGALVDAEGRELAADLAWIAEYVYVLTNERVPGFLSDTADHWDRAVVAVFDAETETCTEATLLHSADGEAVEQARYEGAEGLAGQDLLYRFAMAQQFRFRAFAHAPPAPMVTPTYGAFDAVVGMGWDSEEMRAFESETGVAPTAEGLAFLEADPVLDEGEFYDVDDSG